MELLKFFVDASGVPSDVDTEMIVNFSCSTLEHLLFDSPAFGTMSNYYVLYSQCHGATNLTTFSQPNQRFADAVSPDGDFQSDRF